MVICTAGGQKIFHNRISREHSCISWKTVRKISASAVVGGVWIVNLSEDEMTKTFDHDNDTLQLGDKQKERRHWNACSLSISECDHDRTAI